MSNNILEFADLLGRHSPKPELAALAAHLLRPIFARAHEPRYEFEPTAICPEEVAAAIELAAGVETKGGVFISRRRPLDRPRWMTEEAYAAGFAACSHEAISRCVGGGIGVGLRRRYSETLTRELPAATREYLVASLRQLLCASLWQEYRGGLKGLLFAAVWDILLFFCQLVLVGDAEGARHLSRLVEYLPGAVPLGEKKDEPGVWLIMVA